MKIVVPVKEQVLDQHFGHAAQFALLEVHAESRQITAQEMLPAPAHEHGVLPAWLAAQQVQVVIAGGMGEQARALLAASGIEVITGAPSVEPAVLVQKYLEGNLPSVERRCGHTCSH